MRRRRRMGVLLPLSALATLALSGVPGAARAQACGPGPNWVDTCPGGLDVLPTRLTATLDLSPSGGGLLSLVAFGETTVWHAAGSPHADMPTELVRFALTGFGIPGPGLPPVKITVRAGDGLADGICDGPNVRLCSLGAISELPGDPRHALSFFDVFFEITGPFPRLHTWYTHQASNGELPCRVVATITMAPPRPGTDYVCLNPQGLPPFPPMPPDPLQPIPLYDDAEQLAALLVPGNTHHHISPEPGSLLLLATGAAGVVGAAARRRRRLA